MKLVVLGLAILGVTAGVVSRPASAAPVHVLTLTGPVEPAIAKYLELGIARAADRGAEAVVIEMNTPGGLVSSMQEIVRAMLNARIPVIVYISPRGANAGSAGTFITIAAHVAAMAPGTNIGAAHPVSAIPMPDTEETKGKSIEEEKAVNYLESYIGSIARERGRNEQWARKAVRESVSVGAHDAVKLHVVDFIADDLRDLLAKSHGRKVRTVSGTVTLATAGAPVENYPMSWYTAILHYLAHPYVAYFLMLMAIYGIIFEISNPGAIVPGVVGGIALILLLYSFSVLPLNAAGLLLVVLAIVLFIADVKVPSHGVLTAGGVIAFFLGSLMIFGAAPSYASVPVTVLAAGTLATAGFFIFLVGLGARALSLPVVTGRQGIVGQVVQARTDIAPSGKIFTEGTWWTAFTDGEPILAGEKVKIVGMEGLRVKVVKES